MDKSKLEEVASAMHEEQVRYVFFESCSHAAHVSAEICTPIKRDGRDFLRLQADFP